MSVIKKNRKFLLGVLFGLIIAGGVGVIAATQFQASEVGYKGTTVDRALDTLYEKANAKETICIKLSGTSLSVGSKYVCNLGETNVEPRIFYVLKNDTNDVEMIMERNITDTIGTNKTMNWSDATQFFDEEHPGYQTKQTWLTKVKEVKLPDAQAIADAGGISNWDVTTATTSNWSYFGVNSTSDTSRRSNYKWLYDYTRECSSNGCSNSLSSGYAAGYWTTDLVLNNSSRAWEVDTDGNLSRNSVDNDTYDGVRPVIVVSKSSLAG